MIGKSGFNVFFGAGKDFQLNKYWSIQSTAKFQYWENPMAQEWEEIETNIIKDLISTQKEWSVLQHASLQASASLNRSFHLFKGDWQVFGGGFIRMTAWEKEREWKEDTRYYEIIYDYYVYDSIGGGSTIVNLSGVKLNDPYTLKSNYVDFSDDYHRFHFGIHGGITFPVVSSEKLHLKGQIIVAHDLNTSFREYHNDRPNYRLTSISTGLLYQLNNKKTSHAPAITDEKKAHPDIHGQEKKARKKSMKKIPLEGLNAGVSNLDVLLTSFNAGYLSKYKIGLDISYRHVFWDTGFLEEMNSYFIGAVYQLRNPRIFAKIGVESVYWVNQEWSDLNHDLGVFAGGKYLLPFSKRFGLQMDFGAYFSSSSDHINFSPALGVGLVLARFGPKT